MVEISFRELSDEQQAVVECSDQYITVIASAGSGKTEVIAQRVERLLADSEADFRVLALSYTRRAAAELRDRFAARLGDACNRVETDTLHGFAQNLLLRYGSWIGLPAEPIIVVDDADRIELLEDWRNSVGLGPLPDARRHFIDLDLKRARGEEHPLADQWASALAYAGALDYEAMLSGASELLDLDAIARLVARLYRHIIVDEAQNLTHSQYAFLERLLRGSSDTNALMVGDDKQSIVGFAGASVEFLRRFESEFDATKFRLTCNFRSAEAIVRVADSVASRLGESPSFPQKYAATGLVAKRVFDDEQAEGEGIAAWIRGLLEVGLPPSIVSRGESCILEDRDIAILARSASALKNCEAALLEAGISVARATHADDWLMSDFGRRAWTLATFNPDSAVSRRRLIRELEIQNAETFDAVRAELDAKGNTLLGAVVGVETPERFIEILELAAPSDDSWFEDQQELVSAWQRFCDRHPASDRGWSQFDLFIRRWQRGDDKNSGVRLQTVHKSQGREFKVVAIVGLNEGQFPDFRARSKDALEAELRAFYVAVTRPSRYLLLSRPRSTMSRNGRWSRSASQFLRMIPDET